VIYRSGILDSGRRGEQPSNVHQRLNIHFLTYESHGDRK
jgi:hypothetical protein